MKQLIKLRFKKWWFYLSPSYRRWVKTCDKEINKPENLDAIQVEAHKRWLNVMLYGTSHPEFDPKREQNRLDNLWQQPANEIVKP